ncbi:hypothetical protein [Kangiella koreensis]|uniref:Uncharacterized protein n=1 Tax=Kangiella koreensis (strain DSM 16069 / JCM 12317 / KCTC 12182 / SW-125) TaxID=523791 RepID=C7R7A7_KANKD|nr:hypothetical protein [Kangiella koreensis]ACV25656.1 hypothetical protein Kkor_0235 [Kangiella koreensis DSM 16069]
MLISRVLSSTLTNVENNKIAFLRLSYLPIVCFLIIEIWLIKSESRILLILAILLNIYVYSIFCIGIHRLNLIGKRANPPLGNIRLKLREWNYIGYLLIIGLFTGLAQIVGLIPYIGHYLAIVLVIYVFSRLALVLPAVAIDRSLSIKEALHISKQYHLETFLLLGVIPTLTILPLYLLDYSLISQIVSSIYTTTIMIFNIGLISQTYELLVGVEEDEDSSSINI